MFSVLAKAKNDDDAAGLIRPSELPIYDEPSTTDEWVMAVQTQEQIMLNREASLEPQNLSNQRSFFFTQNPVTLAAKSRPG